MSRDYITKSYSLDIDFLNYDSVRNVTTKMIYSQEDTNTAFINANLKANNETIDLSTYDRVIVAIKKPDDTSVYSNCVIKDVVGGIIEIPFTTQSLAYIGNCYFEVILYKGESQLVSPKFSYRVTESIYNDGIVESQNEVGILTVLISNVSDVLKKQ